MPVNFLGIKYKQPNEIVACGRWGVNFAPDLVADETITKATITVYDSDDKDVTTELVDGAAEIDGAKVSIGFKDGDDGENYKVTIVIETDLGLYEGDFEIYVRER